MEDKKTHKLPKNGPKTIQVTSSNYVMTTPCLISNNEIREESPKKVVSYDFGVEENLASPLIKSGFCFHPNEIRLK